jgi:hypothetical protein
VSHLLFVYDVLCFCLVSDRDIHSLKEVLTLFKKATGMEINEEKSVMYTANIGGVDYWRWQGFSPSRSTVLKIVSGILDIILSQMVI